MSFITLWSVWSFNKIPWIILELCFGQKLWRTDGQTDRWTETFTVSPLNFGGGIIEVMLHGDHNHLWQKLYIHLSCSYQQKTGFLMTQLTLKTPRKPVSENDVCLCPLLNILANFSNLFLHTGKQCGPRSDCSFRSSLIWVHTVYNNDFESYWQKTKQTTIVVIGALRVEQTCA